VDDLFVYGAGDGQWRCLARCWQGVEGARASGGEGKDDGARTGQRTGASSNVPVHALARPDVVITPWPGLVVHGLALGSCPAGSVLPSESS
jgi:hypothetical protein